MACRASRKTQRPPFAGILVLALALIAAVLVACADTTRTNGQPTETSEDAPFKVAVFYYEYDDVYIGSVRDALTQNLATAGIPYQEYDADHDQTTQSSQIDDAMDNGASLLIVNIVSSGNAEKTDVICQKAERAGIPVIFFNRPIEQEGYEGVILNYYSDIAFVGTDPAEAGHLQGQMIGTYLVEHFDEVDLNDDGRISYALFKGEASNVEAIYRTKYSVQDADRILTDNGLPVLMYFDASSIDAFQLDLTGSWSMESAQDYMMTNLAHYNEQGGNMIELVIANSDSMAQGAILALQVYGYNLGTDDCTTIPVFGVDASKAGRQLIADGVMTGTVSQDPVAMAECIGAMARNAKAGNDLLDGMDDYPRDKEHGRERMICLPYFVYRPEGEAAGRADGGAEGELAGVTDHAEVEEGARD